MKAAYFYFVIFLLANAQEIHGSTNKNVYNFRHFSFGNPFSEENIRCVFQDSRGYIWLGIESEGLCKYNGNDIEVFSLEISQPNSLSSNYINDIEEDHNGNLWLATEKGLNILNRATGKIIKPYINDLNPNLETFTIFKDAEENLWIGNESGLLLYTFNASEKSHTELIDNYHRQSNSLTQLLQGIAITTILKEDMQTFWMGSKKGLFQYNFATDSLFHWQHTKDSLSISDNEIISLIQLDSIHYLIGTDNGVNYFDCSKNAFTRVEFRESGIYNYGKVGISDMLQDKDGVIWIGTNTYGIITGKATLENPISTHFTLNIPQSTTGLKSNYITDLFEDSSTQIWSTTKFGGAYIHDRRGLTFPHYTLEKSSGITEQNQSFIISAQEDHSENIWIGTRDKGIIKFNPTNETYQSIPLSQIDHYPVRRVETIYCDEEGIIWAGHKKGLNKIDTETGKSRFYESHKVMAIAPGIDNNLIIGTPSGIYCFEKKTGNRHQITSRHTSFFNNPDICITCILKDDHSSYWFGTDNHALFRYFPENDSLIHFQHNPTQKNTISGYAIRHIFQDSKGRIWIGTKSSGLNLFEGEKAFTHILEKDGLPSNTIFSVLEDRNGFLWITTNNGICRFDPKTNSYTHFNKRHGLQGNVFEKKAAISLRNGQLFIAGNNGFNLFDPILIHQEVYEAPLAITTIRANNEIIKQDVFQHEIIEVPHNKNILSFEFAALDFRDIEAIKYQYRLKGIDKSWITAEHKNSVTYSNLPHGHYELQLKATNADGLWIDQLLSLGIIVKRPPWLSWWAKLTYTILIISIAFFIYWLATIRSGYLHHLQTKELELKQVNELHQLKLNFFTNISHELRTPLTLIIAPLEKLRKSHHREHVHKSIALAYKSTKKLLHLTDQLMYFRKVEQGNIPLQVSLADMHHFLNELAMPFTELAENKNIHLEINIPPTPLIVWFDKDKVEKMINNLIVNAFKFTPENGTIRICANTSKIYCDQMDQSVDVIKILIEDTGKGIHKEDIPHIFDRYYQADGLKKGSGIGLELVKSLITIHKGKIEVASEPGIGTTFTVSIPVERVLYSEQEINQSFQEGAYFTSDILPEEAYFLDKPLPQNVLAEFKVLIAEDNATLNQFLEQSLRDFCHISTVKDGEEALATIPHFNPHLIIADIMMPKCNGLELCKKIKTDVNTSHIPVVLLTARNLESHQIEGYEHGADAYVVKPFDMDVLKAQIKGLLKNRQRLIHNLKEQLIFEPETTDNPIDTDFLTRIIDIIRHNYKNANFSVEEFAKDLNMSRSQLFRKMKSLTDQTPSEYLYAFRIKKAITLLEERHLNIAEIAYQTGFSSPNSFTKTFTRHMGISPSRYMKNKAQGH